MSDLDALSPRLLKKVDWLEVRADLMEPVDVEELRRRFRGPLLFTLRSEAEGGRSTHSSAERRAVLSAAAEHYDFVDVELVADGDGGFLDWLPQSKRVLSWHGQFGSPTSLDELRVLLARQQALGAAHYKLIAAAQTPEEALPSLLLQAEQSTSGAFGLTSFAMGESASWSRLVAAVRGCALVYGACSDTPAAAGQLSVAQLIDDYFLDRCLRDRSIQDLPIEPARQPAGDRKMGFCGILGAPVAHSLSPRLHNGGYRDAGIDGLFVPIATADLGSTLAMFRSAAFDQLGFHLKGFAVTTPHKDTALHQGDASTRAIAIGAANTLIAKSGQPGGWIADSTDPEGITGPLRRRGINLRGVRAAVVGAGGAGRAAAFGLLEAGALVTLVNRTVEAGERAAQRLAVEFAPLAGFDPSSFEVIVNATSLGHQPDDPLPFSVRALSAQASVVDMVYLGTHAAVTAVIAAASNCGLETVDGREVLLHQAIEQFRRMNDADLAVERAATRLAGGTFP